MTTVTDVLPIGRRLRDLAGLYGDAPAVTCAALSGDERTVSWLCGLHHVRETIPFPRMMERLTP